MLNNYERIKNKNIEKNGQGNYWIEDVNTDINTNLKIYEPNKSRIAQNISMIRGKRTKDEFSKLIGVSPSSVSHYENKFAIPSNKTLKKIIKLEEAKGLTVNDLLYGKPREYLKDIFGEIRDLTEGDRANFYEVMEKFLLDNPAYYGYEDSLVSQAIQHFASFKYSPDFIMLARLYGVEKQNVHMFNFNVNKYEQSKDSNYRYEIERRAAFHKYIMPMLEKELHKFDDLEEVAIRLKNTLSLLEFEKEKDKEKE